MATPKLWYAKGLTGGGSDDLDYIDGDSLTDLDIAIALESNKMYTYLLDDDSAETEDSPLIIAPDANPGNKRWIIQGCTGRIIMAKASDYTVKSYALQQNVIFTNDGAGAQVTLTLPAGVAGYSLEMQVVNAQYFKLLCTNSEKIRYEGQQTAANGYIRANVVGRVVKITFTADDWLITGIRGAWNFDQ